MICSSEQLRGILPVVISGGRPELKRRPTHRLLPALHGITASSVWAVRSDQADEYEDDGHEISAYPYDWALEYARSHWSNPKLPERGDFLSAAPGREWACRLAEERGYQMVLQIDDNIDNLSMFRRHYAASMRIVREQGGLGMYADVLGAITLSTNGYMVGAFLAAVPPGKEKLVVSRPGFPYSLFIERVGPGREEYYGPFEDDIIHAFTYGMNSSSATALLVPMLNYAKEHKSGGGTRDSYDNTRAVALQKIFPEAAKIGVFNGKANGRGGPRVYHKMIPGAIRTPQVITDHELYGEVRTYLTDLAKRFGEMYRSDLDARVAGRISKHTAEV